ncbi:hypothetical protein N7495_008352 [Penicillium taxi]|uniref:uncharacterized protein n=1 Tax=Penicillium taxi TaxID=168475 RepID=UPI0025452368|nr:uncharacterized protein N7495_008352 [Penicillium taxi]KAJ5888311.1 hypothetical protein N7495_008352 [Penicillium taxi]
MVGVPRSRGCALCVKRRVKCDERIPECAKCEKYGKPCPGYNRGFKFITGKPYRSRRRLPGNGNDTTDIQSPESVSPSIISSDRRSASQELIQRHTQLFFVSADLNVLQSLSALVDDFSNPTPALSQKFVVSQWFGLLPDIYGQSKILDAAIKSFVTHHLGKLYRDERMLVYARSTYGEALHRLRKSLANPSEYLSSHVFCAVVMLCLYELFTNRENPESWIKHAQGLGQLVRVRGPGRYRNKLDISLLKVSRGLIVMHSMFSGEPCFLASNEWHQTMKHQYVTDMPADYHDIIESFFAYFTYAPSLVHKLFSLREIDPTTPEAFQVASDALSQALDMRSKLDSWYDQWCKIAPLPVEELSTDDALYPVILTYAGLTDAQIYCGYYSYMVIIHETLKNLGYIGPHADMVVYYRDQICKSIEFSSKGALGPYRVGFSLRVAIEVADPVTKSWIINRLEKFSKIYAAAQPENYQPVL